MLTSRGLRDIYRILGECLLILSLPGKALRTLVDIARLFKILKLQGGYLLISSLPGKASRMFVDIARLAEIKRILGECILISNLQGNALRTFVGRAIQHAFSKQSLVNLISKDANLVFYLSVYPLFH